MEHKTLVKNFLTKIVTLDHKERRLFQKEIIFWKIGEILTLLEHKVNK